MQQQLVSAEQGDGVGVGGKPGKLLPSPLRGLVAQREIDYRQIFVLSKGEIRLAALPSR